MGHRANPQRRDHPAYFGPPPPSRIVSDINALKRYQFRTSGATSILIPSQNRNQKLSAPGIHFL
jgi:hypothetical protein